MRHLATIRNIASIRPIPGADKIEVAQIDGWECVVAKADKFKLGDKVVYIEIDSIVPERPGFEFLRDRKFRVRTIKLRKQISQGLVLPLTILPEGKQYNINDDVTDILGIKKYDPQAEQEAKLLTANNTYKTKILNTFQFRTALLLSNMNCHWVWKVGYFCYILQTHISSFRYALKSMCRTDRQSSLSQ